jgi:hypothetical protein
MRSDLSERPPAISSLLAVEREIVPEPDQLRERAVDRARASLPRSVWARSRTQVVRRLSVATAVAAAVALVALCAAAYEAGYRFKIQSSSVPATPPAVAPLVVVEPPVQLKQAEVQADEPEPASEPAWKPSSEPSWTTPDPAPVRAAKARPPKPAAEAQAYAMELLLLQPALEAVARRDFATSLSAITAHQRRFPAGQLAEEREGLRVKTLLGLGRIPEAVHAGALFRERFPHSALLGQIQELLGTQN